ncbi:repressor LexA [candidate division WOR-1 bacterium RIFOXYC2_FULL_37_10]|uniref:LexA repressor n=1 Tax=candidate division WOR-1 bacterium RIFOXYB2_FULL_37_13 TaxID=1802579 RepID=A0A1F4SKN3_UNCSA|nr:MAG: repressor LexA [candidate division WOR-1 bacterium RIFOXYA2_FULL_37_7]OGC20975.1 MAG: repressor LexA [candidate division WOR-1 bacterium RIFOXYB2_FULL_37_13]OGC35192.1 MAG: repressor LexA [candidate division WOR-1 bacterium RIFOXYC2_FULL_37_10]
MSSDTKAKILQFVKDYISSKGFPPSIREIAKAFHFASPRSAQKYLEALETEGAIVREKFARGIKLVQSLSESVTLPFLGFIAAGAPIEVVEQREEIDVPRTLVGRKPCYVLQVRGNSMIEDHILDGDFVVIEKANTANNGEVVVALISKESATLKRMYREKDRIRLEPANSTMKPIYVRDVAVQGVVKGLFRRF